MSVGDIAEYATIDIEATGKGQEGLAAELIRRAIELHVGESRGDRLSWFLSHPALTESIMTNILDSNPSLLTELGHLSGSRELLHLLAQTYQYPEAILTIAKQLYTDSSASVLEFQSFLEKHPDDAWMLKSLAHLWPSSQEKDDALVACLGRHRDLYDYFIEVRRSQQRQLRAAHETNAEAIQELFATRDPAVLRKLALNPHTPELLLRELVEIKEMKRAKEIRELARCALRRRSKAKNG